MEQIEYGGWPNCVRLSNDRIELVATTDVGPRIIRFGFSGGRNLFKEFPETLGKTGGDAWRLYGGHRLWHAPEVKPRTYCPDNDPVAHRWDGRALRLRQQAEPTTGIAKEIQISLDAQADHVTVVHRLTNEGPWTVRLAPWALTVMAAGGRSIFPQEPYRAHTECLDPARPLVLWHYTDMSDPRWVWGKRYVQLKQDPGRPAPQKAGFANSSGWAAYVLGDDVFLKCFGFDPNAAYPDGGCNTETFTNQDMLEIESLGPLVALAPGASVEHTEHWSCFKARVGEDDDAIDADLLPLLSRAQRHSRAAHS